MKEHILQMILYAGADRTTYRSLEPELAEANRRNLVVFTLLVSGAMAVMLLCSLFDASLEKNRMAYAGSAALSLLLFAVVKWPAKQKRRLVYPVIFLFTLLLFSFGIALGTYIEPNETSVSFPILLFAVPLLFTVPPLQMWVTIALGIAGYFAAAIPTQDPVMLGYNSSNILPYGLLSMILSAYMMRIKVDRYVLVQKNRFLSESDQLTGMLNRRSFEQHLQRLQKNSSTRVRICVMDVNGLKAANDNLGHATGDELICGAADSIRASFEAYGKCYRIGGDEFAVIIEGEAPENQELKNNLLAHTRSWRGSTLPTLSLSIGIAEAENAEGLQNVLQRADADMYANKAAYYSSSGTDRRKRS